MLVLTRKPGDLVQIGPSITVKVLEIRRGRAKLGIIAPDDIDIWRDTEKESDSECLSQTSTPTSTTV